MPVVQQFGFVSSFPLDKSDPPHATNRANQTSLLRAFPWIIFRQGEFLKMEISFL